MCVALYIHLHRFGAGYTLQAKVNPLLAGLETPENTPKSSSASPLPPLETAAPEVNRGTSSSSTFSQESGGGGVGVGGRGGGEDLDTTALKHFLEQSFPGAALMEEHQVCVFVCVCVCVCVWGGCEGG